jgi:hypothetical protein
MLSRRDCKPLKALSSLFDVEYPTRGKEIGDLLPGNRGHLPSQRTQVVMAGRTCFLEQSDVPIPLISWYWRKSSGSRLDRLRRMEGRMDGRKR